MKSILKSSLKYIFTFIATVILGIEVLYIATFIPKVMIKDNTKKSATYLAEQGEKFYKTSLGNKVLFHNSTDAIMLNITYGLDEDDRFEGIMKGRRNHIPGSNQDVFEDSKGNLISEYRYFRMTKEFDEMMKDNVDQSIYEYGRYWHGYIVPLRIMLIFGTIIDIRIILQLIVIALLGLLTFLLIKKHNKKYESLVILLSFFMIDLITWSYNVQGMFVMLISLIASCLVAGGKINSKNLSYSLFVIGMFTAYLDFLTVPFVTCLMPIIINNLVKEDNEEKFIKIFIRFFKNIIAWGIGYVGFWAAKWVVSDLFLGTDIIKVSLDQIFIRLGVKDNPKDINVVRMLALKNNFKAIMHPANYAVIVFSTVLFIVNLIRNGFGNIYNKNCFVYHISIFMVLAWYLVCADHSMMHWFFTYRLTIILIMSCLLLAVQNNKKKKDKKERVKC